MANNNINSLRVKANDVLFCLQCLYQNGIIDNEDKNQLVNSFRECLSDEKNEEAISNFRTTLQNVYRQDELPLFLKQEIWRVLNTISCV